MESKISFNKIQNGKKILLKQRLLTDDNYIPENIIGREKEIKDITFFLSDFFKENPSLPNLFIFGFSGTGKSLITNCILEKLSDEHKKTKRDIELKIVRIKGTNQKSKFEVLKMIHQRLSGSKLFTRDASEIYNDILEMIALKKIALIIFIDEIHELKENQINEIIYTISRIGEDLRFYKPKTKTDKKDAILGYILISNDPNLKNKLKSNTRSALYEDNIIFRRYDAREIYKILKERIEEGAIRKDSINKGNLELISGFAVKEGGDARYGLLLLRNSAMESQRNGLNKISQEIITEANLNLKKNMLKEIMLDLPDLFLEIIFHIYILNSTEKELNTGNVFYKYSETNKGKGVSLARVSQIISELADNNIVYTTSSSKKGRTRKILIDENKGIIEEVLKIKGFL